jgi:acetyltransferase EpsM
MATIETPAQGRDPSGTVTARPLIVVGGGEHARVVAEAAGTQPDAWRVVGYTDPASDAPGVGDGVERLGDDAALATLLASGPSGPSGERPAVILGFGSRLAARRATAAGLGDDVSWAAIVHIAAWVSPTATVEPGAVILAGATVNAGARVGAHAIVNSAAVVEHDVVIGTGCHVGPGAVIGGGTRIGADTLIGLGAAVRDHLSIGDRVTVGMGAVVVDDIPDGVTVLGNPARIRVATDG